MNYGAIEPIRYSDSIDHSASQTVALHTSSTHGRLILLWLLAILVNIILTCFSFEMRSSSTIPFILVSNSSSLLRQSIRGEEVLFNFSGLLLDNHSLSPL
jgi:hypothetical protein